MKFSLAALRAEWQRADRSMRYYIANHVLANLLMVIVSLVSVAYGALGFGDMQIRLLGVAMLCGAQAMFAWAVLDRRFKIRYSLW